MSFCQLGELRSVLEREALFMTRRTMTLANSSLAEKQTEIENYFNKLFKNVNYQKKEILTTKKIKVVARELKHFHQTNQTEVKEYLNYLFRHKKGNYKHIIRTSENYINLNNFDKLGILYKCSASNMMISIGCYKNIAKVTHTEANLKQINLFCLDIDYPGDYKLEQVLDGILNYCNIPTPNIVEYGHRMRLIYILAEPLLLNKAKTKLLKGYKFLGKCYCQMINDEFGYNAEPQSPTSFVRVIGSINSKDGSFIKFKKLSEEEYTMQELFDYVPETLIDASGNKEEWYDKWVVTSRKGKVTRVYNSYTLWNERLEWLDSIQCLIEKGNREGFLFVYLQALMWSNNFTGIEQLYQVNSRFSKPLLDKEVRSKFQANITKGKKYKLSNSKIEELVGMPLSKQASYKRRKREEQIKKGQADYQKMEIKRLAVQSLAKEGLSQRKIATQLGIALCVVNKLIHKETPYTIDDSRGRKRKD